MNQYINFYSAIAKGSGGWSHASDRWAPRPIQPMATLLVQGGTTLLGKSPKLSPCLLLSFGISIVMSSLCETSLNIASLPSSSTSSITNSSLATISTSNEAKAANGSASENSRLVMAILLKVRLRIFLSADSLD